MGLDHLWAGWRAAYFVDFTAPDGELGPDGQPSATDAGLSIFEQILASGEPDEATKVLARGEHCFAILNVFPYCNGHLMVMPLRAVAEIEDLDDDQTAELWKMVRDAVVAIKAAYHCDGLNVGLNLGRPAGAGVPDHLHVHVLPRWFGDTNFMTAVAETRVLPESLDLSWQKLRDAWPDT
jgi:ATP adenylyltransferase